LEGISLVDAEDHDALHSLAQLPLPRRTCEGVGHKIVEQVVEIVPVERVTRIFWHSRR
jgi:hypothetical protein